MTLICYHYYIVNALQVTVELAGDGAVRVAQIPDTDLSGLLSGHVLQQ